MQYPNNKAFFAIALIFGIINASQGFKRIIGGNITNIELFPYNVIIEILLEEKNTPQFICGGSLIHPEWVLSATHCFPAGHQFSVEAGASNVDLNEGERRNIKQIYKLGDHLSRDVDGDIALLRLEKPLPINDKIQTIKLPPPSTGSIPLLMSTLTGWGVSEHFDGKLRYANLPIRDEITCKYIWRNEVKEDIFCAGYINGGIDNCQGDSGGPLVVNGVLYGVVSGGSNCNDGGSLGIYIKVPYYVKTIKNIMALNTS